MNKELYVWDFTLKYDEDHNLNTLKDNLSTTSKAWAFQLEEGDSGYKHWQGRLSLIKKSRLKPLIDLFKSHDSWNGVHFSMTSNNNTKSFNYVLKDATRLDGPWTDKDEIKILTRQMSLFNKWGLRPWQQSLKDLSSQFCLRTIDLIYDPTGNNGKSLFSEHMEYEGLAEEIPAFRLMDDIFQWVAGCPGKPCYIVDMPRGMKKDKLGDFYSGIEVIKNGVAFDKRYKRHKVRFDRPRIFIFTNTLPVLDLMSLDRWKIHMILKDHLIPWDPTGPWVESDED